MDHECVDCRDPPEAVDEEHEHFDAICRVSTEERDEFSDCRDDILHGHEDDGRRVITSNGDVFLDPLSSDDVAEIRDPPPRTRTRPLQVATLPTKESIGGDKHVGANRWPSPATHRGENFGSFLHRTEASVCIPLSPMDQRVDHNATDDEEEDQHYQPFGKDSSAAMDSCSYTYSDSSVSDKENAHERNREEGLQQKDDDLVQRRMDIAVEVGRTLSSADEDGENLSQLKLIAVLDILSSMSVDDDGTLKQGKEVAKVKQLVDSPNAKEYEDSVTNLDGDNEYSYSAQVEEAVKLSMAEAAPVPMSPVATHVHVTLVEGKEAVHETSVESQLKELLGLAPDIDYASVVAGWDESARSQLSDVTEKISPAISNFMESKEVKGSIKKISHDIVTVLETFDISINIDNLKNHNDIGGGGGGRKSRKSAPLQTANTENKREEEVGSACTSGHQQADIRPFIRTKSLSPISKGEDLHENEDAYMHVQSSTASNNKSFFDASEQQMQKNSTNNGEIKFTVVEDVPCLKPSRFKGGGALPVLHSSALQQY